MAKKTSKQAPTELPAKPSRKATAKPTNTRAKAQTTNSHNKKLPIKKVSRTEMLNVIASTGGRFFTSTHIGKDEQPHTINGIRYKKQDNEFGYIKVYCAAVKEMRLINPQTLTDVSFGGVHYQAKK